MAQDIASRRDFDRYGDQDMPILKSLYRCTFLVQATSHLTALYYGLRHPKISVIRLILGCPEPFRSDWDMSTVVSHIVDFCQSYMTCARASWVLWNLYSVWNLRRLGYIGTQDMLFLLLAVICGQLLVGARRDMGRALVLAGRYFVETEEVVRELNHIQILFPFCHLYYSAAY